VNYNKKNMKRGQWRMSS